MANKLNTKKIEELEKEILQIITLEPRIKASEISKKLNIERSEVNKILYYKINDLVFIDSDFRWSLITKTQEKNTEESKDKKDLKNEFEKEKNNSQMKNINNISQDINHEYVSDRLVELRGKLLDLTRRNPLINFNHTETGIGFLRIVDEIPEIVLSKILNEKMSFKSLPETDIDPPDENNPDFEARVAELRLTDNEYLTAIDDEKLKQKDPVEYEQLIEKSLRNLKNKIRHELNMPELQTAGYINLKTHAKIHGINPDYDLGHEIIHSEHEDEYLQTLLTPSALDRRLRNIYSKYTSHIRESGINVLYACFGFLEYPEVENSERFNLSPIAIIPISMNKIKTKNGAKYEIEADDDKLNLNLTLIEKLKVQFDIQGFPNLDNDTNLQNYFDKIQTEICLRKNWKVRNFVTIGALPFSTINMYVDMFEKEWGADLLTGNPNVAQLLGGTQAGTYQYSDQVEDIDRLTIEDNAPPLITDADSSQHTAIYEALKGKSLVIQGPPGTGKSQTITNLIAAFCSEGKNVLFVAEKQTALNVVANRLKEAKLNYLVLEPQRNKNKESFLESLNERLELKISLNDEEYKKSKYQLKETIKSLNLLKDTFLIKTQYRDLSLYDLLWKSIRLSLNKSDKNIHLNGDIDPILNFSNEEYEEVRKLIEDYFINIQNGNEKYFKYKWLKNFSATRLQAASVLSEIKKIANYHDSYLPLLESMQKENVYVSPKNLKMVLLKSKEFNGKKLVSPEVTSNEIQELEVNFNLLSDLENINELITPLIKSNSIEKINLFESLIKEFKYEDIDGSILSRAQAEAKENINILAQIKLLKEFKNSINLNFSDAISNILKIWNLYKNYPAESFDFLRNNRVEINTNILKDKLSDLENINSEINAKVTNLLGNVETINILNFSIFEVRNCREVFQKSGALSFLSKNYSKAKLELKRFGFLNSGKQEAIQFLLSLEKILEQSENLILDKNFKNYIGLGFEGAKTKISYINDLSECIRKIDEFNRNEFLIFGGNLEHSEQQVLFKKYNNLEKNSFDFEYLKKYYSESFSVDEINLEDFFELQFEKCKKLKELCFLIDEILFFPNQSFNINSIKNKLSKCLKTINENAIHSYSIVKIVYEYPLYIRNALSLGGKYSNEKELHNYLSDRSLFLKNLSNFYNFISDVIGIPQSDTFRIAQIILEFSNENLISYIDSLSLFIEKNEINDFQYDGELIEFLNDMSSLSKINDEDFLIITRQSLSYGKCKDNKIIGKLPINDFNKFSSIDDLLISIEEKIINSYLICREDKYKNAFEKIGGRHLPNIKEKFKEVDNELKNLEALKILSLACKKNIPQGISYGPKKDYSDKALIQNELHKQKGHIPIRQLITRARNALLAMKPIWLMQPLAVSQFLPREKDIFDVVIIDEASQMLPEYAIGSIARSKQVIVVGDSQQMPPSNLFNTTLEVDDEDEQEIDSESILDMAANRLGNSVSLKVHYRSRHSSLIQFSNERFYRNSLRLAPSPIEDRSEMGVFFVPVNGSYSSGLNIPEANEVILQIKQCMARYPDQSIGIITINSKQMEYIEEELNRLKDNDKIISEYWERWEGDDVQYPLITNLERVQGSERDIIIISTVYGPDEKGQMYQRFPLINSKFGHRRLNVLFTRAKNRLILVSSLRPSNIDITSGVPNRGKVILKEYIEYASGSALVDSYNENREADSDFEVSVISSLRGYGFEPIPQVGVGGFRIDIGVKHPDFKYGFLAGIECDGATYHSSPSARDRDRIRQDILESLGWKIYRIWSTDWFDSPNKEIEKLVDWLNKLLQSRVETESVLDKESEDKKVISYETESSITQVLKPVGVKKDFIFNDFSIQYYEEKPGLFQVWVHSDFIGWIERDIESVNSQKLGSYGAKLQDIKSPKYVLILNSDPQEILFDSLNQALIYIVKIKQELIQ